MNRRIHVMQIIDSMNLGGAEVLLRDLTQALLAYDLKVNVCYNTSGPVAKEIEAMGVQTTCLPRLGRVDPVLLWRIYREIKRIKPDIVHTHLFKSDFHGRLAARLAGTPVVISTIHSCLNWAKNPILGSIYGSNARLADHIIAVSDEVRDYCIKYLHLDPKKITTIANAIPLDRFGDQRVAGITIRQELNIPSSALVIGIVARLSEPKDHANFLRAAQKILIDAPETYFLIVGDGSLGEFLKALAVTLGIQKSTIFCGARQDIPAMMGVLDILVFSSLWEGLPVALLEGMASFLPVVATSVGGIPGVIQHGLTGLLVPPGSPDSIAEACLKLIKDAPLRKEIGRAGCAQVRANYGMDGMISKTIGLYQTLLQGSEV